MPATEKMGPKMSDQFANSVAPFIAGLTDGDLRRIFRRNPRGATLLLAELETSFHGSAGANLLARSMLMRLEPLADTSSAHLPLVPLPPVANDEGFFANQA